MMVQNYLKIAFRNLKRNKIYSAINIIGLAIGMTCTIFLLLLIFYEFSFDRYHKNAENIYRIVKGEMDKNIPYQATAPPSMAAALKNEFPEIVETVRIDKYYNLIVRFKDTYFMESNIVRADPSIFKIFTFPFIKGNPETALAEPNCVVITKSTAKKYFGTENPINKELICGEKNYKITGILKDIPETSHFHFDICFSLVEDRKYRMIDDGAVYTYILLPNNYPAKNLQGKLPEFVKKYEGHPTSNIQFYNFYLQPLTDIHLHSHLEFELGINQKVSTIYLFSSIAFLILLIACINFMNLSTARSSLRAREIGIRKTAGASRKQLIGQLLGESFLLSFIATILAAGLVELLLPFFNNLAGRNLSLYTGNFLITSVLLVLFPLLVGLLAGIYPAFFLSAFRPVKILRKITNYSKSGLSLRQGLVTFQFLISTILIIVTAVIFRQFNFMRNADPGFNKEQVVAISTGSIEVLKNELLKNLYITNVSAVNALPGKSPHISYWASKTNWNKYYKEIDEVVTDYNFLNILELELIDGRGFSLSFSTDVTSGFILNETAVKYFEIKDPIGHFFQSTPGIFHYKGNIIGVIKDFHYLSLHSPIRPLVICLGYIDNSTNPVKNHGYLLAKITSGHIPEVMKFAEEKYKDIKPDTPFEYYFLDELFDQQYKNEAKLSRIFGMFTTITIFVSCLGLFGLATFSTDRRTKEIGIRKILGASVSNLVLLLTKEFLKLVLLANLIAWPIVWLIMTRWLQNFAFKIDIQIWLFFTASAIALVIALLTVSYQAIHTALANPVDALRYE
jgi:putative ABC transport system permease protein